METTVKCPICSKNYIVYRFYVGDQSVCLECRARERRERRMVPKLGWNEFVFLRRQAD